MKLINLSYFKAFILLQNYISSTSGQGRFDVPCYSQKVLGDCVCNGEDQKICSAHAFDQGCIGQIQVLKTIKYNIVDLTSLMFEINSFDNIKCDKLLTFFYRSIISNKTVDAIFSKAMSKVIENFLYIEYSTKYMLQALFEKGAPNVRELYINDHLNTYSNIPYLNFESLPNLEVLKFETSSSLTIKPRAFSNLKHLKNVAIHGSSILLKFMENSLSFESENLLHVDFSGTHIELEDLKKSNLSNTPGGLVVKLVDVLIKHFPQNVFERFFKENSNIELDLDRNRITCNYWENQWIFKYEARQNENFPVKNVNCLNYGLKNLLSMQKCEFKDYDKIDTDCSPTTISTTHSTTNNVTDKTTSSTTLSTSTISSKPNDLPTNYRTVNFLQNYLIFIILGIMFLLLFIFRLYFYFKKHSTEQNNQDIIRKPGGSTTEIINPVYNTSSSYLTQSQINIRNIYSRVRKYLRIFHFNETMENRPLPQIESGSNAQIYSIGGQTDSNEEHIYETINYNNIYETIE